MPKTIPSRKPNSIAKCDSCRKDKKKLKFDINQCLPEHRAWPSKCDRCIEFGLLCSKGKTKPRPNHYVKALSEATPQPTNALPLLAARSSTTACLIPSPFQWTQQENPYEPSQKTQEAIFLLGMCEVINMALEELEDIVIDMTGPFQHYPHLDAIEKCMPGIDHIMKNFADFSRTLRSRMLKIGAGKSLSYAQSALTNDCFRRKITCTPDASPPEEVLDSINLYRRLGHAGFAHVLQLKLLLQHTHLMEGRMESASVCRSAFLRDVQRFLIDEDPSFNVFTRSQMFVPRKLVRLSAMTADLTKDGRPDCLGRSVYNVLYDAGLRVQWPKDEVNHADILGRTALHMACRKGDDHGIKRLLELSASVNQTALNGLQPLHFAAIFGTKTACGMIWSRQRSDETTTQDIYNRSPFLWAAFSGRLENLEYLQWKTSTFQDYYGCTAVGLAAVQGHSKIVSYLVKHKFASDTPDFQGRTPFWYAARNCHCDVMKILRDSNVDINHTAEDGLSPLAVAAKHGSTKAVSYLLGLNDLYMYSNAFSPNNDLKLSPMVLASAAGKAECVQLLMQCGSWYPGNPMIEEVRNIAQRQNNNAILRLLPQNHSNSILSLLPQHLIKPSG